METSNYIATYGGHTFEEYQKAVKTVSNYLDGLTGAHMMHDKLTEDAQKTLTLDSMMASVPLLEIMFASDRFREQLKAQMERDGYDIKKGHAEAAARLAEAEGEPAADPKPETL